MIIIPTLGLRFQWLSTQFIDEPVMMGTQFAPKGWMNDYLLGVFLSVIHSF